MPALRHREGDLRAPPRQPGRQTPPLRVLPRLPRPMRCGSAKRARCGNRLINRGFVLLYGLICPAGGAGNWGGRGRG